jgi:tripartite-type tricarboxylate transporter receptor subunit TctC
MHIHCRLSFDRKSLGSVGNEGAMSRRALLRDAIAIAATLEIIAPLYAAAEVWPSRPMTMVVPYAAGGTADPIARVLAGGLSQALGQQVIVENVGGAGGTVGTNRVAKAAPDGYQFVFGTIGSFAQSQTLYKHPPYRTLTDFAPVALVAEQPVVLVARKDLPVRDLREFIAYARENQTKMQYGSPGVGSGNQFACMLLNAAIKVEVTHVPYRGGGPAMQDLIAGRTDYQCLNDVLAKPLIDSGAIKAIAVLTRARSPNLPDLASAHEQGLAEFDMSNWFALALPKASPETVVRKLNDATLAALNSPAVQEQMEKIGGILVAPDRRSPEYLEKFFRSEIARWAEIIKANGLILN